MGGAAGDTPARGQCDHISQRFLRRHVSSLAWDARLDYGVTTTYSSYIDVVLLQVVDIQDRLSMRRYSGR
jgi:hypothetical protein